MTATLYLSFLLPLAAAGIALINAGLCRSRNAAHSMLAALGAAAAGALAYVLVGYTAVTSWPVSVLDARAASTTAEFVLLGTLVAAIAAVIPLGAGADRWRLGPCCVSVALFAGVVYPVYLRRVPGVASVHAAAGMAALSIAWILGPRRGKYNREGMPAAIPGHSIVLVFLGCWFAWIGLSALNCLGAADRNALAVLNTTLSAAAAVLAAAAITRARFGKPDASLCANGWVAGLVSASAGCSIMPPAGAILVGLIGGALAIYSIEWLELYLSVDDPGGAISVHGIVGIWSLLSAALFNGQWLAQVVAVSTLLGLVLPVSYAFNLGLNRVYHLRVAPEAERQGLDLHELGAGAYPDFLTHNEDSWPR